MPDRGNRGVDDLPDYGFQIVEIIRVVKERCHSDQLLDATASMKLNKSRFVAGSCIASLLPDIARRCFVNGNPSTNDHFPYHSIDRAT